jgi:hypothetical protein
MKHKSNLLFGLIFLITFACPFFSAQALDNTSNKTNAIGVIFGEPTGITAKFLLQNNHAIDAGLALSFDSYVLLYSDYLFQFPGAFGSSTEFAKQLKPYVGVGAEFLFDENTGRYNDHYFGNSSASIGFGIRIPLGVEWVALDAPIGVFVELVPGVGIAPGTYGFVQGGVGARLYF